MIDPLKGILYPELLRQKAPKHFPVPPQGNFVADTDTNLGKATNSLVLMNARGGTAQKYDLGPTRYGAYLQKGLSSEGDALVFGAVYFTQNTGGGNFFYEVPDVRCDNANFAVSSILGIDDLSGSSFQYFSSSGTIGSSGAVDFYIAEDGQGSNGRITFRTTAATGGGLHAVTSAAPFGSGATAYLNQHLVGSVYASPRGGNVTPAGQGFYSSGIFVSDGISNNAGGSGIRIQDWHIAVRTDNNTQRRTRGVLGIHTVHNRFVNPGEAYMLAKHPYASLLKLAGPAFPELFPEPPVAGNEELSIDSGSFTVSGGNVDFSVGRALSLDSGSFNLAEGEVNLLAGVTLSLDSGTFSTTGGDLTFSVNEVETLFGAAFNVTGGELDLIVSRAVSLEGGSFTVSGGDLGVSSGRVVSLDAGSFSITGGNLDESATRTLSLAGGSYAVTGGDLALVYTVGYGLALNSGSFVISGGDVSLTADKSVSLDAGSFTTTGGDLTLAAGNALALDAGSFTLTGGDVNFAAGNVLELDGGTFAVTGGDITFAIGGDVSLTLEAGSYTVTGGSITFGLQGESTIVFANKEGADTVDVTQVSEGELVINLTEGKIYTRDSEFNLITVGGLYDGEDLPRTDPQVAGQFWNNDGVLSVSNG